MINLDTIRGGIFGVCVGDALGVPVEFRPRSVLKEHPVTTMTGHGMHNQPLGTWSDDSSLTLCLVDSLCGGFNTRDIADKFEAWLGKGLWTAHGSVFDIGSTTFQAICDFTRVSDPTLAGPTHERSNGNGSLMRILPMALAFAEMAPELRMERACQVSRITHGHVRSQIGCAIYVETAVQLLTGVAPAEAIAVASNVVLSSRAAATAAWRAELAEYSRVLNGQLARMTEDEVHSSGYVVHTLEAALWCLLTSDSYAETVLKAVNLGDDTDTTGAVAGGLAGIVYGPQAIPQDWLDALARRKDIETLCRSFAGSIEKRGSQP